MRKDRKRNSEKRTNNKGLKKFASIWGILYIVLLLGFEGLLIYINLLPIKYMCIILVVLTLLSLFILPGLLFRDIKKKRKIVSIVTGTILMIVYCVGILYMGNTLGFFSNVFGEIGQKADYCVVVNADSKYEELEDISGETLETMAATEATYSEAKLELSKDVDVKYDTQALDLKDLCAGLTEGNYEGIFISKANYDLACDEIDGYDKKTKILYTVSVPIEGLKAKDVDVTSDSFNILISGNDTTGAIEDVAKSDVNMLMTVNPKTKTIVLTSIPRDYYVYLPGKEDYDKLTHSGNFGISETTGAIEKLLGVDINYYVKVNFNAVVELVDAIGGIDVISDYTFTTSGRQNNGYSFVEGKNHLDGANALAFSRERHSFADGDRQRGKNQQKVIEGMIKKCTTSTVVLTKYTSILNAVEDYMQTNMESSNIKKLVKMQISDMSGWKIKKQSLDGTGELTTVYSLGDAQCYVMKPDEVSVANAYDKIYQTMVAEPEKE